VTLVDTSIWIEHLRRSDARLSALQAERCVVIHPLVIEELACGNLPHREELLGLLEALPAAPVASHHEILAFVERERLYGLGLGPVDVHLLASARLAAAKLWTRDTILVRAAERLGLT